MAIQEAYPGIAKATLEIAYDNGCVNAQRTEEQIFADLDKFFKDRTPEHSGLQTTVALHWQDIDRWLSSVPADVLTTVCAGEEQDAAEAMVGAPRGTDTLLNELFEKVC